MTRFETPQNDTGWRKNPLIGLLAAIVLVVGAVSLLSRLGCRRSPPTTDTADSVQIICRKCGTVYPVTRSQVGLDAGADVDVFHRRASEVACPKCGATDSVVASTCPNCGGLFAAPTDYEALQEFQCPHCKEYPFRRK